MSNLSEIGEKNANPAQLVAQGEAEAETRSLALPSAFLIELFGAAPVLSGVSVTPANAMACTPVRAAVEAISEAVGGLPLHLYQRGEGDARTRATDHPAYGLLHDDANDWTSATKFREQLTRDALLHGNGYGEVTLTPYEAACYIDVSNQLLEDSSYNIEAELSVDFAEEFGRLEGAAFVAGDGSGKPEGYLNGTLVTEVKSGQAATLGGSDAAIADLLRTTFYALPAFYRADSAWAMNSTTMALVSKLKDGQGRYHWQDGLVAGQPPTLLGRPVIDMPDMPDVGANAAPIVLADFNQMYRIADRVELAVLRDPFSRATNGQTRFHARRRVGGGVMKGEAGRKIVCKV